MANLFIPSASCVFPRIVILRQSLQINFDLITSCDAICAVSKGYKQVDFVTRAFFLFYTIRLLGKSHPLQYSVSALLENYLTRSYVCECNHIINSVYIIITSSSCNGWHLQSYPCPAKVFVQGSPCSAIALQLLPSCCLDGQLTPCEAVEGFTGPVRLDYLRSRGNDEVAFQHRMSLLV